MCATVIGFPEHCAGIGGVMVPHRGFAMIGMPTAVRGPHPGVVWPPFARISSQMVPSCSATVFAMIREVGASTALLARMLRLAPMSPDFTSSPRSRMVSSAKSTKSSRIGTCAGAAVANRVARRAKSARSAK